MGASDRLTLCGMNKKLNPLFFFLFYEWLFIKETTEVKKAPTNRKGTQSDYILGWQQKFTAHSVSVLHNSISPWVIDA